ncbi:hypothetical protein ACAG26_06845 [Mycobacterium sp. pUA109]|uniref:hypothetical protein n=1 Tax=Mycobacterium sp. pUA109 TaxID=3238982 RepID=UPI00351B0D2B
MAIVDKGLSPEQWGALREATSHLGNVGDRLAPQSFPDENGLHLSRASVSALNGADATVIACYTFTSLRAAAPTDPGVPTTSEATFGLHKTDNWYLHDITDDHVVPGCQSDAA